MIANRILIGLLNALAIVVLPLQIVSTLVLGLAVTLTFGLLLLPFSLVWVVLFFPLLALSNVTHRAPLLRAPIGVLLIPWVLVADTFVCLVPSMGELESRAAKLMLCQTWPFSWECWQFMHHRLDLRVLEETSHPFVDVIDRVTRSDKLMQRVVMKISAGQPLDSDSDAP